MQERNYFLFEQGNVKRVLNLLAREPLQIGYSQCNNPVFCKFLNCLLFMILVICSVSAGMYCLSSIIVSQTQGDVCRKNKKNHFQDLEIGRRIILKGNLKNLGLAEY